MLTGWNICRKGMGWVLGDGKSTSFWYDVWLPNGKTIREQIQGPLRKKENNIRVGEVILKNNILNLNEITFELSKDILLQINCTYTSHNKTDKAVWRPSPHGTLSTTLVYKMLAEQDKTITFDGFRWIWPLHYPNKIKYFIWLCQHKRLPTRKYLHSIGIKIDPLCHICNKMETIEHIFVECYNYRKKNVEKSQSATIHKSDWKYPRE